MPGISENFAIYLGEFVLKALAIILLIININRINEIFKLRNIKYVLGLLLLLFFYRTFHVTSAVEHPLVPLISILWIIIIYQSINTEKHFEIFVSFLYLACCIVLFSAGLDRIYDFSRLGYLESRSDNALTGMAVHYITYAQMAMFSFYLSLFFLFKTKSNFFKILFSFILITSFISLLTSGSRGAILAVLISLLFLLLLNKRFVLRNKLLFGFFFLVTTQVLLIITPLDKIFSYFQVIGTEEDVSSLGRMNLYVFSLESFYDAPFFGFGWDYVRLITKQPAHSVFLQLLAELGLLGLILEFLIYRRFYIIYKSLKSKFSIYNKIFFYKITPIFSLIVAFLVWSLFENIGFVFGTRHLYFIAVLILCIYKINFLKRIKQ